MWRASTDPQALQGFYLNLITSSHLLVWLNNLLREDSFLVWQNEISPFFIIMDTGSCFDHPVRVGVGHSNTKLL